MKNIYVGNLSFKTTQDELRDLFAQFGEVSSVNIITDRMTGQSKGFAFVEMADAGAQQAIDKLNQTDLGGRTITVNEARPREENRPSGPRRGGFGDDRGGDRGGFGGGRRF
ncbi:MAG: RNA-binding protein [Methylococcaceae bacterium]|jgi:cold-inducible RNA-binding protein|nr:RNA-binding protein [Methylococcaceae bacterium]